LYALLETLQGSEFATWMLESSYGYPVALTFHSMGLAIVVGLLLVLDLRVLGVARFSVNAVTGLMIFISDAVRYFESSSFRLKLLAVGIAMVLVMPIARQLRAGATGGGHLPASVRACALASIVLWLGAIVFGRLMAYV
jgi:hypothetical protein